LLPKESLRVTCSRIPFFALLRAFQRPKHGQAELGSLKCFFALETPLDDAVQRRRMNVKIALLPMRRLTFLLIALLLIVDFAQLQAAEPAFRPALIGNGPTALINVIDTKK